MDQQDQRTAWSRDGNVAERDNQHQAVDRAECSRQGEVLARVPDLDQPAVADHPSRRSSSRSPSRERSQRNDGRMISPSISIKLLVGGGVLLVAAAIFLMNRGGDDEQQPQAEGVPSWQPGNPAPEAEEAPTWGGTPQTPPPGMFQPNSPAGGGSPMTTGPLMPGTPGASAPANTPAVSVGPSPSTPPPAWNPPANQPGIGVAPPATYVGGQQTTPPGQPVGNPAGQQPQQPAPQWDRYGNQAPTAGTQSPTPSLPSVTVPSAPEAAAPQDRYGNRYDETLPAADYRYAPTAGVPQTQANRGMTVGQPAPETRYTPAPQTNYPVETPPYREDYRTGALPDDYRHDYRAPATTYPPANQPADNYPANSTPPSSYPQNGYPQNNYPQNSYPQNGYPQNSYPQSPYPPNNYTPNNPAPDYRSGTGGDDRYRYQADTRAEPYGAYPQQPTEPGVAQFHGTIERPSSRTDYDRARPSVY